MKSVYARTRGSGERRGLFRLDVKAEKTNRGSRFSLGNAVRLLSTCSSSDGNGFHG
jgi:hypothetical protein